MAGAEGTGGAPAADTAQFASLMKDERIAELAGIFKEIQGDQSLPLVFDTAVHPCTNQCTCMQTLIECVLCR